jgi:Glycosyl transferase family 2
VTAPPTVGVLIRTYNDRPYLAQALDSALNQVYPGRIVILLGVDMGTTDGTAELIRDRVGWTDMMPEWTVQPLAKPRITILVVVHPHMTLAAATRYLLPKLAVGGMVRRVLFLDGDNYLDPDCVARRVALHPENPPGLCASPVRWGVNEGAPPFPIMPPGPVPLNRLLPGNLLDTLNPLWSMDYLMTSVLPRVEKVPPGDLVDDYLFNLVAGMDDQIDFHPIPPTATYRFRKGSLTERTDVQQRTIDTKRAFVEIYNAESGRHVRKLDGSPGP